MRKEARDGAAVFVVRGAKPRVHFVLLEENYGENQGEPNCRGRKRPSRARNNACARDGYNHSCIAGMADVAVKADGDELRLSREFRMAHEFHVAEIFCRAIKNNAVRGDKRCAEQGDWNRRSVRREQFMAKKENEGAPECP